MEVILPLLGVFMKAGAEFGDLIDVYEDTETDIDHTILDL